jgi:hypothetical protein
MAQPGSTGDGRKVISVIEIKQRGQSPTCNVFVSQVTDPDGSSQMAYSILNNSTLFTSKPPIENPIELTTHTIERKHFSYKPRDFGASSTPDVKILDLALYIGLLQMMNGKSYSEARATLKQVLTQHNPLEKNVNLHNGLNTITGFGWTQDDSLEKRLESLNYSGVLSKKLGLVVWNFSCNVNDVKIGHWSTPQTVDSKQMKYRHLVLTVAERIAMLLSSEKKEVKFTPDMQSAFFQTLRKVYTKVDTTYAFADHAYFLSESHVMFPAVSLIVMLVYSNRAGDVDSDTFVKSMTSINHAFDNLKAPAAKVNDLGPTHGTHEPAYKKQKNAALELLLGVQSDLKKMQSDLKKITDRVDAAIATHMSENQKPVQSGDKLHEGHTVGEQDGNGKSRDDEQSDKLPGKRRIWQVASSSDEDEDEVDEPDDEKQHADDPNGDEQGKGSNDEKPGADKSNDEKPGADGSDDGMELIYMPEIESDESQPDDS